MTEIVYDPGRLVSAAQKLDGHQSLAADIKVSAKAADMGHGFDVWGAVGRTAQLNDKYQEAANELHESLELPEKYIRKAAGSLVQTAENYRKADGKLLSKIKDVEKLLANPPKGKVMAPERPPSLSEAGPVKFDLLEDMPVISSMSKGIKKAFEEKDFADLSSFVGDAAGAGMGLATDPKGFLGGWGLTFLIDVIQPLEDALAYVTGHPEKIDDASNQWDLVGKKLSELSKKVLEIPQTDIAESVWRGPTSNQARARMTTFTEGLDDLVKQVTHVRAILGASKAVMEIAQAFIIELIVTLTRWLVATWVPAMAAAPVTFGASTASAAGVTGIQATIAFQRASAMIRKVRNVLIRLSTLLRHLARHAAENKRGIDALTGFGTSVLVSTPFKMAGTAWQGFIGDGGSSEGIRSKLNPGDVPAAAPPPKET
ncbi:hypothetical protein OHR68_04390 [Spirillospora sp. NBC_00431]